MIPIFNYFDFFKGDLLKLKIFGGWLNHDFQMSKYYKVYYSIVNSFLIVLFNTMMIIYWILNSTSIKQFAAIGYILMICLMAQVKSFFIYFYRDNFEDLFIQMKEDLFQPRNKKELSIITESLKFYWKIKTALITNSFIASLSAISVPLFYQKGDGLPVNAWYPLNVTYSPLFEIAYVHQGFSIFYISVINIYMDVIVAGTITFTGIQCDILCERLKALGKIKGGDDLTLGDCVEHHWAILRFSDTTEKVFGKIYFGQIFASTIALCMDLFLLNLTDPKTFEFFYLAVYQIAIANLLLVPCWFATEMTKKSENIPTAAYCCYWTDAPKSFKMDLLFFITRSQKPIKLYAMNFFQISVETFVKIIKSSLSYYAVLKNLDMSEENYIE